MKFFLHSAGPFEAAPFEKISKNVDFSLWGNRATTQKHTYEIGIFKRGIFEYHGSPLRKQVWKTLKNYMHKVLKGLLTSHGIVVKAEQMEFDFFARVPCVTCQCSLSKIGDHSFWLSCSTTTRYYSSLESELKKNYTLLFCEQRILTENVAGKFKKYISF